MRRLWPWWYSRMSNNNVTLIGLGSSYYSTGKNQSWGTCSKVTFTAHYQINHSTCSNSTCDLYCTEYFWSGYSQTHLSNRTILKGLLMIVEFSKDRGRILSKFLPKLFWIIGFGLPNLYEIHSSTCISKESLHKPKHHFNFTFKKSNTLEMT
jgi:hypothetical protein